MTTTASFQKNPDFWRTKEEALNHKETKNTNPRYKHFTQDIFHAGDEEQFQHFRDATNGNVCDTLPSLKDNLFELNSLDVWDKYKNVKGNATIETFRYIFHKFKKGIFVKIKDNKLKVFLPFSKANFTNEWGEKIQIDPRFRSVNDFFKYITDLEGLYHFREGGVNQNFNEWYGNNCLVRYEYPLSEGDSNVGNVKNMLEELCNNFKVPDIEFFINRRDFPILTKDGTEPYNHIWGSNHPLVSHSYDKYLPILSMSKTDKYADVLIPTWDDWARIQSYEKKYFPETVQDYSATFDIKWSDKKPTAVFRGTSTGCGVDLETNPRLKLAYLSTLTYGGVPYLDAKLTKWNLRPRKLEGETYLKTIDIDALKRKNIDIYQIDEKGNYIRDETQNYYIKHYDEYKVDNKKGRYIKQGSSYKYVKHGNKIPNFLSPKQQSGYKYIVHVDGHVSAFRLSLELSMGSVILLVESQWKIWYRDFLLPFGDTYDEKLAHYIPVKEDLSDLIEKIQWCRDNDEKCEQIAKNALHFFRKYLQKDGVLQYMQKILVNLKKEMGTYLYNSKTPLQILIQEEYKNITRSFPKIEKNITDLSVFPPMKRCFGLLQGMEFVVRKIIEETNFENVALFGKQIFENTFGTVREVKLAGFSMIVKTTTDSQKIQEHIHEAFVGIMSINKLLKFIPNFSYIFGLYENKEKKSYNVVSEFINGETLFDYINSAHFSVSEFIFIVLQLCLALEVAQNTCGFVHYDLTPWNIIIQRIDEPKLFDYILSHKRVVRVSTSCIPVIIDYGKSHVIHQGVHHGFVNMFKMSTIQDIIILLIKSIDQIINKKKLNKIDRKNIIDLMNFISNTRYCPKTFNDDDENVLVSMGEFLKNARKYASLISDDKYELENLKPFDLVIYIKNMKDFKFSNIGIVKDYQPSMDKGNGRQVFEFVFSNTDIERLDTYVNVFFRLKNCTLPESKNLFFIYYTVQTLENNLTSVQDNMLEFLKYSTKDISYYQNIYKNLIRFIEYDYDKIIVLINDEHLDFLKDKSEKEIIKIIRHDKNTKYHLKMFEKLLLRYYEDVYKDFMSFLERVYKKKIKTVKEKKIKYVVGNFNDFIQAQYTEETFLDPEKILSLIKNDSVDLSEDLSEYKEIIEIILLNTGLYKLSDKDKKYYLKRFDKLLDTNSLKMKNNSANKKTLKLMAHKVYEEDKTQLESTLKKTCDYTDMYIELYNQCIN
jgi:serine/threonine protein kinase